MTHDQLEAIRKRSDKASGNWIADYLKLKNAQIVLTDDVPALLAEVERLQRLLKNEAGKVREYYDLHGTYSPSLAVVYYGKREAVRTTLNLLGIKIEGVNA